MIFVCCVIALQIYKISNDPFADDIYGNLVTSFTYSKWRLVSYSVRKAILFLKLINPNVSLRHSIGSKQWEVYTKGRE
jgi:hypothetical protein